MSCTDHDIDLARKLLSACIDDKCYRLPVGITQKDVDRLCELGFFDATLGFPIIALCDMEQLERIEQNICKQRAHDDNQQAIAAVQKRADKKEAFRHDAKVAAVSAVITFCLDHIDGLYGLVKKLIGLFFSMDRNFSKIKPPFYCFCWIGCCSCFPSIITEQLTLDPACD